MNQVASAALPQKLTQLLVVNDHPIIFEGLVQLLNREPDLRVKWLASSAGEALGICKIHCPDMAIVDISLRDASGVDLIKVMHDHWPSILIVVMSVHDESLYAERAVRAGARGYVMKHLAPKHVVDAIRLVRDGQIYLSDKMRSQLLERAIAGGRAASTEMAHLSDRELEVFQMIGQGLKKRQIAMRLRRSVNTVETHRMSIKRKLKVGSSAELARLAFVHAQGTLGPQCGLCPWATSPDDCPLAPPASSEARDRQS